MMYTLPELIKTFNYKIPFKVKFTHPTTRIIYICKIIRYDNNLYYTDAQNIPGLGGAFQSWKDRKHFQPVGKVNYLPDWF